MPLTALVGLIRRSPTAKAHVKALPGIKALHRVLIQLLSRADMALVLNALRALTTLVVNEPLEKRLFNSANIHQTFILVFNMVLKATDTEMLAAAVELLGDLLKSVALLASLHSSFGELEPSLRMVLRMLHPQSSHDDGNGNTEIATQITKLLLLLVQSSLRKVRSL